MSVLITGHRGYIGSALLEFLQECLPENIVGYDIVEGNDITNYDNLLKTLQDHSIKTVIHLAAMSSVSACNDSPQEANRINGYGTMLVLKAMEAAGCHNIIYASTSSVYGNSPNIPFTEDSPVEPCSLYGSSKLLGEYGIHNHYEKNPGNYVIFRMFNVVGTSGYRHIDTRMSSGYDRLFAALESGKLTIYGNDYSTDDGTGERDYVSLRDVCNAYLLAVLAVDRSIRETVNISTGTLTSVQKLVGVWNECTNKPWFAFPKVVFEYGCRREGDPAKVCGSNDKAKKVLGWKPTRKIEDIIYNLSKDKNTLDV